MGKRVSTLLPGAPWHEVIGVVQDVYDNGLHQPAPAIVYWPALGSGLYGRNSPQLARAVTFALRTSRAGTQPLLGEIKQAVWAVNGQLPLASVRTMQEAYDASMARTSFTLVLLGASSVAALLLGVVGIYGAIAYAVSQRAREIGIRVALGAQRGELTRMFVRSGVALCGAGVLIGVVAAAGLTQAMAALLFGVTPLDPVTFTAVPCGLLAVALLASYIPARRAARVSPVEALKAQ